MQDMQKKVLDEEESFKFWETVYLNREILLQNKIK